jgi:hypothetical protein
VQRRHISNGDGEDQEVDILADLVERPLDDALLLRESFQEQGVDGMQPADLPCQLLD